MDKTLAVVNIIEITTPQNKAKCLKIEKGTVVQTEEMYTCCVAALKEYVETAGFSDVVIGLSGGIDSSVVAALSVEAFGAEHVHGVLMPGPYSSDHSIKDASDLAANLGIETMTAPITSSFDAFKAAFDENCGTALEGVAAENTQARFRMMILMALSNAKSWMVVNTGNKSEAMMGYSTLYGDTCGAYAPIGGVYKTDVFVLARYINDKAAAEGKGEIVPQHVLVKPPSAELSPGQEDEKNLGICYKELDKILIAAFEDKKTPEEIAACGFELEEVNRVIARAHSFAYKRAMEPPFPGEDFYL